MKMKFASRIVGALCLGFLVETNAFSIDVSVLHDKWKMVEIPDTFCGNGSPYRFFIRENSKSNNLAVISEPGGACWDYNGCYGRDGIFGAANPDGIPEDFMSNLKVSSNPIINAFTWEKTPFGRVEPGKWNKIFLPYCTGDIFSGSLVKTYEDPTGRNPPMTYHHVGHRNMKRIIAWTSKKFPSVDKLMITGMSAGGTGSLVNYHFWREAMNVKEGSYLLNDSGPIFFADKEESSYSYRLHQKIYDAWGLDQVIAGLPPELVDQFPLNDHDIPVFGYLPEFLATKYPNDRLGHTQFSMDTNYSRYSYEDFYDLNIHDQDDIKLMTDMWQEDQQDLIEQFDRYPNLSYFLPYFRKQMDSHCTTVGTFKGTEIKAGGKKYNIGDYIENLLDDSQPMLSLYEEPNDSDKKVFSVVFPVVNRQMKKLNERLIRDHP